MRNRFKIREQEVMATSRYDHFVKAHKEAAQEILTSAPKRKKGKLFFENPHINKARQNMEHAYVAYTATDNQDGGVYFSKKEELSKVYSEVMAEDLAEKIQEVEACHVSSQHV